MRRVHKITGRCDDMIILRGVNLFPTQIEELILATDVLAPQFQCVLDRRGRLDQMTVRVESRHAVTTDQCEGAAASLTRDIKNRIGVSVTVTVLQPESLERSLGKAKRIIDQRPKN
jgi:phenylacetate-CoA ligase